MRGDLLHQTRSKGFTYRDGGKLLGHMNATGLLWVNTFGPIGCNKSVRQFEGHTDSIL